MDLKAPFPWFGGKRKVADIVWQRFGNVPNYVEPFFGSGAVLLQRPLVTRQTETVNDKDGYVGNFWRAVKHDPEAVAFHADNPVNENDLHGRHIWLVNRDIVPSLEGDPDWYDAKIAGWWAWGISTWIGAGFCSGNGPWQSVDGQRVHLGNTGMGVKRQLVHLGNTGTGVNRKLVHLGNTGMGVKRQRVHLGDAGMGVKRQLVHLGNTRAGGLYAWMDALAERLRFVRVACGDWSRVCGPSPTTNLGLTGVFLDPPYTAEAGRSANLYASDCMTLGHDVRKWAIANGTNPLMRIALCGYDGEHDMPDSWETVAWKADGGYGGLSHTHDNPNARKERIWFSPHCLQPHLQADLFSI